jgi:ligand-binding sensor domain-containing protein/serine phosphatase RsbU (regulator of sigma subunit)
MFRLVVKKYILILILLTFELNAQQLKFKYIDNEDGLSSLFVSSIMQDDLGFMWFGTQDGLNKYDGYQIKVYKTDPDNPDNSLSSNEIFCQNQINHTLTVIGTREGVTLFYPLTDKFVSLKKNKLISGKINAIIKLNETEVLLGGDDGLFKLDFNTRAAKKIDFALEKIPQVTSFLSINNKILVGTKNLGLWEFYNNKINRKNIIKDENFKFDLNVLDNITSLCEYANKIYIGTAGTGVYKVDLNDGLIEENIKFKETTEINGANLIESIQAKNNRLYVATNNGFYIHDLLKKTNIVNQKTNETEQKNGLLGNNVKVVLLDKENNIWLGLALNGVNVSFKQSQKFSQENYLLHFKEIYAFCNANKNELLIGGNFTLRFVNLQDKKIQDISNFIGKSTVLSIYKENSNIYWIGTWGIGLIRYDRSTNSIKKFFTTNLGGTIISILPDGHGNLLCAAYGDGLIKINLKSFDYKIYGLEQGLPNTSLYSLFKDKTNNIWISTYENGVYQLKGSEINNKIEIINKYENSGKQNEIASNAVLAINQDSKGNMWFATTSGLSKLLPNKSFSNFYEKSGLPNSYLYSIVSDSIGNFWMSSNNGIIEFNPLVNEKEINFKSYGLKDGLINAEHNSGAAFYSTSGIMCFGGANGVNLFRPSSIKNNTNLPQSYIVSFKRSGNDVVFDTCITYKKYIKLNWRENYFQLELVALDFTEPTKNKFKFKLENRDNEWSAPTNVRYISYSELAGGDYILKIKACNNDGVWNETPYELHITVVPPFWKTLWFYILVGIFGTAGVFAFIQFRTNAIKKENKILESKVAERTKELAEKNHDIMSSIQYAKRIQEAILPSRDHIYNKLNKSFILYKPKDIVSGDFYWFAEKNNVKIFACVDCTGHGVPGAFMSMIGHNLLHQIVSEKGITKPGEILNALHHGVQVALRQGSNEVNTNDGMDVSLISIDSKTGKIEWAGANRPLIIIDSQGVFNKYDGDKFPIGGAQLDSNRIFTTKEIAYTPNSMAYMFSDGYADQFGGEKGKKFMVKRFYDLLLDIHTKDIMEQKYLLLQNIEGWKGDHEQVDDVLVIGIGI